VGKAEFYAGFLRRGGGCDGIGSSVSASMAGESSGILIRSATLHPSMDFIKFGDIDVDVSAALFSIVFGVVLFVKQFKKPVTETAHVPTTIP